MRTPQKGDPNEVNEGRTDGREHGAGFSFAPFSLCFFFYYLLFFSSGFLPLMMGRPCYVRPCDFLFEKEDEHCRWHVLTLRDDGHVLDGERERERTLTG